MRILGVIPARGGSQGIPRKNLLPLGGVPLIVHAVRSAQQSKRLTRFIVSTDSPEIAEAAQHAGAEAPFLRPEVLAQSTTPTAPVIQHAIMMLAPDEFDVVVTIQATAPLRTGDDIDAAIELLTADYDSVVSVAEVPHQFNPQWVHQINDGELSAYTPSGPLTYTRRQDLPSVYYRNGAVYVTRCAALEAHGNLYGERTAAYVMPPERSVNIDAMSDFVLAEYFLKQQKKAVSS